MKKSNKYKFIVLTDLHLPIEKNDEKFMEFLQNLEKLAEISEKIILLGDIFTIWSGVSPFNHQNGEMLVKKIEKLSKNCKFYLVEGNYDFYICEKYGNYFEKGSTDSINLQIESGKFVFTHGHLYTSFKDKLFIEILKSLPVKVLLKLGLLKPFMLKLLKHFEKGNRSKVFTQRELQEFTENLSEKFNNKPVICGHFHTFFQNQNITIVPDYLSKSKYLTFDGISLKIENIDNINT